MKQTTRNTILTKSKQLFARTGYEGFSIRTLAKESGLGISSIYHFFADKDQLLKMVFDQTNRELGQKRAALKVPSDAEQMLLQRIRFQFENIEDIVCVLKYYIHFRPTFLKLNNGYLPPKSTLHIEEVLQRGYETGAFSIKQTDIPDEAKVIAHAINGYLLEYYPVTPTGKELDEVVHAIHTFLMRSLTNKEVGV